MIKVGKSKHGSGNLYNDIYSRYGYRCFHCIHSSNIVKNVVFCMIHYTDDFKIPQSCILGRKIFRELRKKE